MRDAMAPRSSWIVPYVRAVNSVRSLSTNSVRSFPKLGVLPPPLWGRGGEGGGACGNNGASTSGPPPLTPPHKGGGERRELGLHPPSLPGLTPQVGFTRLAALS